MTARSADALATLLLTNHLTESREQPLGPKAFWRLVAAVGAPSRLLGRSGADLATDLGEPELAARIAGLLDASTQLAFALERFESQGYASLTSFDEAYPTRLRERLKGRAPPVLFTAGPVELLSREAIGIVGSRDVSDEGTEVAAEAARTAAGAGLAVVSGGARGVDQRSMAASYQAGGVVVGYLAESLEKRVKSPETRKVIGEGVICLATPFKPTAGFSVSNAMARNKLIYATARTTLVVATDEGRGGTWEGATEALHHSYGAVCAWRGEGEGPGNEALVGRGARPVGSAAELLDAPVEERSPEAPEQLPMNL